MPPSTADTDVVLPSKPPAVLVTMPAVLRPLKVMEPLLVMAVSDPSVPAIVLLPVILTPLALTVRPVAAVIAPSTVRLATPVPEFVSARVVFAASFRLKVVVPDAVRLSVGAFKFIVLADCTVTLPATVEPITTVLVLLAVALVPIFIFCPTAPTVLPI